MTIILLIGVIEHIKYTIILEPFELKKKPLPAFQDARDVFLFLPPMILDEQGAFYATGKPFWSFDSSGEIELSKRVASFLGLSNFVETLRLRTGVSGPGQSNFLMVQAMQDYQTLQKYNPQTNQYAKDQGYPIFDPCNGTSPLTDDGSFFSTCTFFRF